MQVITPTPGLDKIAARVGVTRRPLEHNDEYLRRIEDAYPADYPLRLPLLRFLCKLGLESTRYLLDRPWTL